MKNLDIPGFDAAVSNVILGLMRIQSLSDAEVQALVGAARDSGITYFDHADIYGGRPARLRDPVR